MLNRNFLLLALLVVFGSFLVAFSNAKTESKAVYEYVIIKQGDVFLDVFEQGKEHTQEFLKKDRRNLNSSYDLINKFEAKGYELYNWESYDAGSSHIFSFLLRRKKQ